MNQTKKSQGEKGKVIKIKTLIFHWGWGILFLCQLLLGEIFVNHQRNELLSIFGLLFLLVGLALVPVPFILFPSKGKVLEGENFLHTTVIVDSGIYGMVRHPQSLGWAFLIFAIILIRQNIIITILGSIAFILLSSMIKEEERDLRTKFGLEYKKYMKRVPRWNLPLGIIRYFQRRTTNSSINHQI